MLREKARKLWKSFQKAPPGERFQRLHDAEKQTGGWTGIALVVLGLVLVVVGVALLFIPGPGILLIAFGAALIAQRSLWLAKNLDSVEILARSVARDAFRFWKNASTPARAAVILAAVAGAAAAAYAFYAVFFRK